MRVTCTYRGPLGPQDRLRLQAALHGTNLVQALALVQGWMISAMTVDAPPIIVGGYDHKNKILYVELDGAGCYAMVHLPPVGGGEVWEKKLLSFLKGLPYAYKAYNKLKKVTFSVACSTCVCGQDRTYWLVRQHALFTPPPRFRQIPTPKKGPEQEKKQKSQGLPPSLPRFRTTQLLLF